MDAETETTTPRKALWRSSSWSVRSSSRSHPSLHPLSISRPTILPPLPKPNPSTSDSISKITDHIYLGSDSIARDLPTLQSHHITHILNCIGSPNHFPDHLTYKTLFLHDNPSQDIISVLYDAFDYLDDVTRSSKRVFVHCLKGASRSATIVIGYLMWHLSLSFEDALAKVRSARSVTDPNLGFASQLLQCQSRMAPSSPCLMLRCYRMAPHSPYDPLHLVPKAAVLGKFDSRGAFLVVESSLGVFVWLGKQCGSAMRAAAVNSAKQIVKYEKVNGEIVTVFDGAETEEFWSVVKCEERGDRRVEMYDLDYEMFRRAVKGGVVPPLPMNGETRVPAREGGWSWVRSKFLDGEIVSDCEEGRQQYHSPSSSSLTTETGSTLSTFSPSSNSSSDWQQNSSPSGSGSPIIVSKLPPVRSRKGKGRVEGKESLAERRGSAAPSLVLLPPVDDGECQLSLSDMVRDWCLSPPFISEVGEEQTLFRENEEEENARMKFDSHCALLTHSVLYQWPSLDKVEVLHPGALSSGSIFLLLAPDSSLGTRKPMANILYVWLGRESGDGNIMSEQGKKDRHNDLNRIGISFLDRMGLPIDTRVQIIREAEEPEQFLDHLFTFHQANGSSCR